MPTIQIVQEAEKYGYHMASYSQKNVRNEERKPYTKHLVRLRNVPKNDLVVGDTIPEIVIVNAHDKTTRLRFMLGFFRVVCSNGLITGDIFEDFSYKHTDKNPFDVILQQFDRIQGVAKQRLDTIQAMKQEYMPLSAVREFAIAASKLFPERVYDDIMGIQLAARYEDTADTLWNVYNRIQENLMRGNVTIRGTNARIRKARPINSIDKNITVNQQLWKIAERFLPASNDTHAALAIAA
jgi:hypothetical protein